MKRQGVGNRHQGPGTREQGVGSREQGTGIRDQGSANLTALLRTAVPPVAEDAELDRDLWPEMRARLHQEPGLAAGLKAVPWFDWALAGGVAIFAVAFPTAVPVLLYYL